jgi:hypothetical protein
MSQSNMAVVQILSEVRAQIGEAHSIAKAADLCAKDGQVDRAFEIALDLDELLHSANHLVQAAAILRRVERREQEKAED